MAKNTQMKMQLDKCPRLGYLKNKITLTKQTIELLNRVIDTSDDEISRLSSEFQKIEIKLKVIGAKKQLPKLHVEIQKIETDFKNWKNHIQLCMLEANVDYEEMVQKAKKLKPTDEKFEEISKVFSEYKPFDLKDNYEAKVMFYANLKTILFPKVEKTPTMKKVD